MSNCIGRDTTDFVNFNYYSLTLALAFHQGQPLCEKRESAGCVGYEGWRGRDLL